MMDLVSTRVTTDPHTAGCARLLAAVIAQAVRDAGAKMEPRERTQDHVCAAARRALHWLFERDGVFDLYAQLIGADGHAIRHHLLHGTSHRHENATGHGLTVDQRRALQVRARRMGLHARTDD